jgi:aspartate/methionine/tyrosine aminotransferase
MRLQPFKLERYFAQYEFNVPYLLSSSDCEAYSIQELLALEPGAAEKFQKVWLGYTESAGDPELRREIANLYETIQPLETLVFAGAEEAIFTFMSVALEPGDHIIVHYPCYQSLFEVAASLGCEVTRWEADPDENWELDVEFLWNAVKPNTRAIVINCPHNPTGYLMSREKFERVANFARELGLLLFSDEVYRLLEHNPTDRLPAACDIYPDAVSLGVMSKSLGLPGLRIGWIATHNRRIFGKMAAFKDYLTICNSAPSEFLATLGLRQKDVIVERNREIVRQNLQLLDEFFGRHGQLFSWARPRAGSIAFPRLNIERDIEEIARDLAEKAGVMLLPSTTYDYGNRHFRLGFGRKNMPEALAKFDEYVQSELYK